MEIKKNEATINRPNGDRIIDAPYVFMDIPSLIRQVKEEKAWEQNDRNGITLFKANSITMVVSALKEGAEIKDNMVGGFLSVYVLEGKLLISTSDGNIEAGNKQAITFHPHVQHKIKAFTDSVLLLTTYNAGNN